MIDKEMWRQLTIDGLANEFNKMINNYTKIYDEYYETNSRDSAFLKDLVDSIKGISACLEVYARDKKIHPYYAIEKLNYSSSIIECTKKYYKSQIKKEEDETNE